MCPVRSMKNMSNTTQKLAFVFPGQGAQVPGMGKALCEASDSAKAVFDSLEAIRPGLKELCFNGTKEELSLTINTQPCIFAVSMANAAALAEQGIMPNVVAGFSLGEACALTFAGAMSLSDGFRAVIKRAELMTECASQSKGAMSVVIKLDASSVEKIALEYGVYAVNYNCPGQTVVSGLADKIVEFNKAVATAGGRALPLAVSGAFHSPLMADAAKGFRDYLDTLDIVAPMLPVYANGTARAYSTNVDELKDTFASQIASPVLWEQTVRNLKDMGIEQFIELEPGKVLTGLIGKI